VSYPLRFGVTTFGDVPHRPGEDRLTDAATIREIVDQAKLAESVGIDVFTIGEHHRPDMPISSPEMVLAAIASVTSTIKLGSAVTVLSTDDPVRVYERFATLDAVSNGRAEPILGRGSFTETFPLYGYNFGEYDALFEEKLELWAQLRHETVVDWEGTLRPSLKKMQVYPHTEHPDGIPTWVGVGGNPQSVLRVARHGFNLMLAGLGMTNQRLRQNVDLFHRGLQHFGHPRPQIGVSVNGYIAPTDQQARDELWPQYEARMNWIGRERGWRPIDRASFEQSIDHGMQMVGSPDTVIRKMVETISILGLNRIDFGYDTVSLPLADKERSLRLLGTEVIPGVRAWLANSMVGV
jgi:probable LLM family oxidoreductase